MFTLLESNPFFIDWFADRLLNGGNSVLSPMTLQEFLFKSTRQLSGLLNSMSNKSERHCEHFLWSWYCWCGLVCWFFCFSFLVWSGWLELNRMRISVSSPGRPSWIVLALRYETLTNWAKSFVNEHPLIVILAFMCKADLNRHLPYSKQ